MSFDERAVFGLVDGQRTSAGYDVADGALRSARDTDSLPLIRTKAGERPPIAAADRTRRTAIVLRGSVVEQWDVARRALAASVDFVDDGDEPTAAAFLDPHPAFVVGTRKGRLLRLDLRASLD